MGIGDKNAQPDGFSIYPNPATDNLTIEVSSNQINSYEVSVYDMVGKQVLLLSPELNNNGLYKKTIDISMLKKGVYTVRVKSASDVKSGVFSKK